MAAFSLASDVKDIVERLGETTQVLSGKTVMLTGARGFLGRYFTDVFSYLNEHVLEKPVKVVGLDNFITSGKGATEVPEVENVRFLAQNVSQVFAWDEHLDYVIHAAGIASPFYYRAHPLETLEVAINGTRNMLELADKYGARFTFFSSSEIYGDPDARHVPMQESYRGNVACQGPRACYDEGKRVGETLCYIYHTVNGIATNTIRPFNIYGPGMREADYRVMPNFASRIKGDLPLNVYGSGRQTRTFCYVVDAMVGFFLVVLRGVPGEAYNIGNPRPEVSVMDLVRRMEKVLGRKLSLNVVEYPDSYPADEPQRRCPDIRKAHLQLEYDAMVDLDDGLGRFLSWTESDYTGVQ